MPRGGRREGAGRKSDAETAAVRAMIDKAVTKRDWDAIFKRLAADAKDSQQKGNNKATELLLAYKFGMPVPILPASTDGVLVPIRHIEVADAGTDRADGRSNRAAPSSGTKKGVGK